MGKAAKMGARPAVLGICLWQAMVSLFAGPSSAGGGLPWEVWDDLHRLPELHSGHQVLLRSSHCPTGCRFDRHSEGDWRYISVDGDEGVIFEEAGAGAITRIWMTMGFGVSEPLDPKVRLRVYVDGAKAPVVDLPLPRLFDGSSPPFLPPLVGHRLGSSGGNFSYVPIPYRRGCRVSLVGAHKERIWFQVGFHRLASAEGVTSFTGQEDLSALSALLGAQGSSPWSDAESWASGSVKVAPDAPAVLLNRSDPGTVTTLKLNVAAEHFSTLELILGFDGLERVRMPLADFFAIGRVGSVPSRSLLVGLDASGDLYAYFPMPFFESAQVTLRHLGAAGAPAVPVDYEVAGRASPPTASSGLFGASLRVSEATELDVDFPFLELEGHGKWVGIFAELGSIGTLSRLYLEGDERIFIDGSPHPSVYGTGVEDLFNSGFYFDQGPFTLALHGAPYVHLIDGGESTTAAYRLMPTDGITFRNRIVAGLEGGPEGDVSMRVRIVSYYYQRPAPALSRWDVLDLGDPGSRAVHGYTVPGSHSFEVLDGRFEGEPPRPLIATGAYRPLGNADFILRRHPSSQQFRLRRRFDAGLPGQAGEIHLGGELVGRWPAIDVNADRRWREIDVDLAPTTVAGKELAFRIVAPTDSGDGTFTEFVYELWADGDAEIFTDGFESGDASRWGTIQGVRLAPTTVRAVRSGRLSRTSTSRRSASSRSSSV